MITTINISATPEDVVLSFQARHDANVCYTYVWVMPFSHPSAQQRRACSSAQHIHNNGSYAQMIVWEIMHNTMLSVDEDVVLWLFPRRTLHVHTESVCLLLIIVIIVHKHNGGGLCILWSILFCKALLRCFCICNRTLLSLESECVAFAGAIHKFRVRSKSMDGEFRCAMFCELYMCGVVERRLFTTLSCNIHTTQLLRCVCLINGVNTHQQQRSTPFRCRGQATHDCACPLSYLVVVFSV